MLDIAKQDHGKDQRCQGDPGKDDCFDQTDHHPGQSHSDNHRNQGRAHHQGFDQQHRGQGIAPGLFLPQQAGCNDADRDDDAQFEGLDAQGGVGFQPGRKRSGQQRRDDAFEPGQGSVQDAGAFFAHKRPRFKGVPAYMPAFGWLSKRTPARNEREFF